jgi:hypothetical protein
MIRPTRFPRPAAAHGRARQATRTFPTTAPIGPLFGVVALLALLGPPAASGQATPTEAAEPVLDGKTVEWLAASAVLAAPSTLREGAEVRAWTGDGRLVTIQPGGNGLICLADRPGDGRFAAACYHDGLEPFMERGRELRRQGIEGTERNEARWAEIEAGTLPMPAAGMVYNLGFPSEDFDPATTDPATGGRLHALYMTGATAESTGLPTTPGEGPWLMFPGTPSAHVMIAIPARKAPEEGG